MFSDPDEEVAGRKVTAQGGQGQATREAAVLIDYADNKMLSLLSPN